MSKSDNAIAVLFGVGVAAALGLAFAKHATAAPSISREQAIEEAVALFRRYGGEPLANAGRRYMDVLLRAEAGEATAEELQQANFELGDALEPLSEEQRAALVNEAIQISKTRTVKL